MLHHTQLLNRLVRDKKLVPVRARSAQDITYHDPCYLGRHNKVYDAPRELIGASGAKLTEMPRHADRGLCCGAGGARMWMEEHIGKRVNHERVEEALDTGASKIATGCPFCRVMMTDGVDDVAAAKDVPKAEVLDVAQLLLGSLDKSAVTLPAKGTAAKEPRTARRGRGVRRKAESRSVEAEAAEPRPKPNPAAKAARHAAETKPVTGLGIAGGAKRPAPRRRRRACGSRQDAAASAAAPAKGLGIAAGAKRPGAKKAAPAADAAAAPPRRTPGRLPSPKPEVKGLGIAAGARRPGAKKAAAAPAPAAAARPTDRARERPPSRRPPSPNRRSRASASRRAHAAQAPRRRLRRRAPNPRRRAAGAGAPAIRPESAATEPRTDGNRRSPQPPVKGLGIAKGARPPGKR